MLFTNLAVLLINVNDKKNLDLPNFIESNTKYKTTFRDSIFTNAQKSQQTDAAGEIPKHSKTYRIQE